MYTLVVCDANWVPLGELAFPDNWQFVDRLCDVGSGAVDCPASAENLELLRRGATVLVRREDQTVRQAGLVSTYGVSRAASDTIKLTWRDTLAYLSGAQAWPNPGTETGQGLNEFDNRTGWTSTVLLGFVAANIGPGTGWRQSPGLVVGEDLMAGNYLAAPVQARWNNLLDLCRTVAIPNAAVFGVSTEDRTHTFWVRGAEDHSGDVIFSAELGNLGAGEQSLSAPVATRVDALGKGEGTARVTLMVTTPESLAQEAAWGRSFVYVHESSSSDVPALTAEALRVLAEKGETFSATYAVTPDGSFRYGVDYQLGDFVTLAPVGVDPIAKPVREAEESWSTGGWSLKLTVGDYAATSSLGTAFQARQVLRDVEALKRNR